MSIDFHDVIEWDLEVVLLDLWQIFNALRQAPYNCVAVGLAVQEI